MGELERLSTGAELMPIMRTNRGLTLSQEGKSLQSALRREAADGIVKKAQVMIAMEVAMDIMDSIEVVDDHRKHRAGDDPGLNTVLARIELNYIAKVERIQRGSAY